MFAGVFNFWILLFVFNVAEAIRLQINSWIKAATPEEAWEEFLAVAVEVYKDMPLASKQLSARTERSAPTKEMVATAKEAWDAGVKKAAAPAETQCGWGADVTMARYAWESGKEWKEGQEKKQSP